MKFIERDLFMKRSFGALEVIYEQIRHAPVVNLNTFNPETTAIVIVDMINGFAKEGLLSSHRVEELINPMVQLLEEAKENGFHLVAFADSHPEDSPEFKQFPVHCVTGTTESEVVDEIKEVGGYHLIPKNSTNGFLEEGFQTWLTEHPEIQTFIVIGDCTDICIQQFAVTLKKHFQKDNQEISVIVPVAHVETYELEEHNADLMNIMALYMMQTAGIEIVADVKLGGARK